MSMCIDKCGKDAGQVGYFSFEYVGLTFKVFKSGLVCSDCKKKRILRHFEAINNFLIHVEHSRARINWEIYHHIDSGEYGMSYDIDSIKNCLMAIGVFSFSMEGNWEIFSETISLNPRTNAGVLYFTRHEDAQKYANFYFIGARFNWAIRQIAGQS